jgi:hypothetical protein
VVSYVRLRCSKAKPRLHMVNMPHCYIRWCYMACADNTKYTLVCYGAILHNTVTCVGCGLSESTSYTPGERRVVWRTRAIW